MDQLNGARSVVATLWGIIFSATLFLPFGWVWAGGQSIDAMQGTCGVLETFMGDVQILDSTRTHLVDATSRASIPCGSWLSVNQGWAQLRHQNGPRIHLSAQTFVQLIDYRTQPQPGFQRSMDHLLLYKGQVYIQGSEEEEFRVISATGRTRMKRGKMILIFSPNENSTQLIVLENSATLENRFENTRKVQAQTGESTELNLKLLRVIPTLPSAVSVASLRPKLLELRIAENERFEAIRAIIRRQGRHFAASLTGDGHDSKPHKEIDMFSPQRQPASMKSSPSSPNPPTSQSSQSSGIYDRHQTDSSDSMLHEHWVEKMVGEKQIGERILYPDKYYGQTQKVHLEIEVPVAKSKFKEPPEDEDEVEKKRLLDELSRIHMD